MTLCVISWRISQPIIVTVLHRIVIIQSEIWSLVIGFGFGHASVVFAVHFAIFFSIVSMNISSCLLWFTYWYSYIDTILWLRQIIYRIEECLVLAVLSSGITTQNKAIPRTALQ